MIHPRAGSTELNHTSRFSEHDNSVFYMIVMKCINSRSSGTHKTFEEWKMHLFNRLLPLLGSNGSVAKMMGSSYC